MASARGIANYLDSLLGTADFPDYDRALNGLQLDHRGPVRKVATAVDFSIRTLDAVVASQANMLVLHHGMYWSGVERFTGAAYRRFERLMSNDIAVYASHLPLDAHEQYGNCALLARELDLTPVSRFGEYRGAAIGWSGQSDVPTAELLQRADIFARSFGGSARASHFEPNHRTRRWAVITGAGADSDSLRAAMAQGIDTLIVGEGPHHTTVGAPEHDVVVIYAGHYATEIFGVRALADVIAKEFSIPTEFLALPTGS